MDAPRIVSLALLTSGPRVFVMRRPAGGPLPNHWQFPGGQVEFGEHPWDALRREIREELRLEIARGRLFGLYSHVYEVEGLRAHFVLVAYRVRVRRDRLPEDDDRRWATPSELRRLPIVPGSRPIVEDLRRRPRPGVT